MFWDNLAKGLYEQNKLTESKDSLVHASHLNPPPERLKEIEDNLEIVNRRLKKSRSKTLDNYSYLCLAPFLAEARSGFAMQNERLMIKPQQIVFAIDLVTSVVHQVLTESTTDMTAN